MVQVGAARLRLPMQTGWPLAGYMHRTGGALGIHDELSVRACVVGSGAERVCLVTLDTVCVDAEFVAEARQQIAAACDCPPQAVMIASTHTHSGFAGIARFRLDPAAESYLGVYRPEVAREVQALMARAAAEAAANQRPATLLIGTGQAEGVARNRIRADAAHDPALPFVLAAAPDGAIRVAIFSFASHSTILGPGNRLYSGDLIGIACQRLEEFWAPGCVALGLAGAAGDISTRFTRAEASFAEVDRLATLLADAILHADRQPTEGDPVRGSQQLVQLALKPAESRAALNHRAEDARQRLATLNQPDSPEARLILAELEGLQIALRPRGERPPHIRAEVQLLQIGQALMTGYPGEMFVEYGLATRERLHPDHVLVAGYANDYIGYVPTRAAASGYETSMALVAPESGQQLVEAACALAAHAGSPGHRDE
jgi:neutral ceramidase